MPLLACCIVLDDAGSKFPANGILNSTIELVRDSGLIALCSKMERSSISSKNFREAALESYRVVQAMLAQKAVVPFRFPTWLDAEEMKAHLREESLRYRDFLVKHADHVQMEIRVAMQEAAIQKENSGAEHLRARAAQLRGLNEQASAIKSLVADNALEWREQETPDGVRLYALVSRTSIEGFREKLNRASVRTTGPWPATEFLNQR